MRFKNYLSELLTKFREKQKFVSIIYDDETQAKLTNWAVANGFDLTKTYSGDDQSIYDFEFHTTIFHSVTKHDIDNEDFENMEFTVDPVSFKLLGENEDIPVLLVESESLLELRKIFEDEFDMKDKWPQYLPHISLSYNTKMTSLDHLILPDFELKTNIMKVRNIED